MWVEDSNSIRRISDEKTSPSKLYVLHELLSSTVISVAMVEQANEINLIEWLKPYGEWGELVEATLSNHEKALVAALKATWPKAPHQLCVQPSVA